jgi:hypothetical protein
MVKTKVLELECCSVSGETLNINIGAFTSGILVEENDS